jgi:hypothetical protein
MYNTYAMSANLEARRNSQQASMITAGFAIFMVLLMFFLKWELPVFEKPIASTEIEVELNLPEEPATISHGGGGGGNPVQAAAPAGVSNPTPPPPVEKDDSKDVEDNNDKTSTPIVKPIVVKKVAKKITNTSTAVVKTPPPPVIETPAPRIPKAVAGKTLTGDGKGGGATDYEKPGGTGTGTGVGNGSGSGGGNGSGNGGGNGNASGGGSGPRVTRGDRKIVRSYSFEGDLDKAVVYANINVSPDGIGKLVSLAKGSSTTSNAYKDAIVRYLDNIEFDKADHESMITVQFNFKVN